MNIGIDCDGVLADQTTAYLPLVRRIYGLDVKKDNITTWYWFRDVHGIPVDEILRIMEMAWQDYMHLPLEEPNLREMIADLQRRSHRIYIITHRTRSSYPNVCKWLDYQQIPYDSITFIMNGQSKFEYPIDCLIDDSPLNAEDAKEAEQLMFLRKQPWNLLQWKECLHKPNAHLRPVSNFKEFYDIIVRWYPDAKK